MLGAMRGAPRAVVAVAAFWLLASALPATGQVPQEQQPPPTTPAPSPEPPPRPVAPEPERPVEAPPPQVRPTPVPEEPVLSPTPGLAPPTFVGPDLFNPPPHRGWITLTPSITVGGAYNDNLFLSGRGTETDDFIGGFIPGITLSMQRPEYNLLAGYYFSAEYYADNSELNKVFGNQVGFLDGFYRVSPRLTLSLLDRYVFGRDATRITAGAVSAGRQDSWRNTVTPALSYQMTPLTALNLLASYSMLRFDEDEGGDARDSDSYRASVGADHQFTPRFRGNVDFDAGYFDAEDEPKTTTYTGRVGFNYQFTPTLVGRISGGPTLVVREDEPNRITPSVRAVLTQTFRFGTLQAGYDHNVAAETIGIRDRAIAFASLRLTTLARGLQFVITPRYTRTDRDIEGGDDSHRHVHRQRRSDLSDRPQHRADRLLHVFRPA